MKMNIKKELSNFIHSNYGQESDSILSYIPDIPFDTNKVKAIMINEVVADIPDNDFYSFGQKSAYMETTIPLFQKAGANVKSISDIMELGIYITNAVKLPKSDTTLSTEKIKTLVPIIESELDLFQNIKVIMLMGDVAKKAFNMITKKQSGKNAVPSVSTYKLRNSETFYNDIRVFPSYIMTGKNILIEKSKVEMSAEDIARMLILIK